VSFNRDPRRIAWLADLLLSELESAVIETGGAAAGLVNVGCGVLAATEVPAETSLMQANHLRFIAPLVIELSWRGASLIQRLLQGEVMRRWVTHPYRQVREEVGSLLAIAMDACTPVPAHLAADAITIRQAVDEFVAHLLDECRTSPELLETMRVHMSGAGEAAVVQAAAGQDAKRPRREDEAPRDAATGTGEEAQARQK